MIYRCETPETSSPAPFRVALLISLVLGLFSLNTLPGQTVDGPHPDLDLLEKSPRILFLGDSITASGNYVALFDAWLITKQLTKHPRIICAGLASETVSGLSEDGHAGGKFPRPDLAERLDRVLDLAQPNLVFSCYGINCGIYQPLVETRFEKYQSGYKNLKAAVEKRGAKLIAITPPTFDDQRAKKGFSYNAVLDRYSAWLLEQRQQGWMVIDLHSAMNQALAEARQADPLFTFQPDAVHPNDNGHWFMARHLALAFGDTDVAEYATPAEMCERRGYPVSLLATVQQRMAVLRDAYVHQAGHKRPGVATGLPVEEAGKKADELTRLIPARMK